MARTSKAVADHIPDRGKLKRLERHAPAATRLLKLMASESRLALLCQLGESECSVGQLAEGAGLTMTAVSQHLAKMRAEGLVDTRKEGQTVYYRLNDPAAARLMETLCDIYAARD